MRRLKEQLARERRGPCLTSESGCLFGVPPRRSQGRYRRSFIDPDDVLYCQMQGQQTAAAGAQVAITDALDALPATQRHPNTVNSPDRNTDGRAAGRKRSAFRRHGNSRTILPFYQRWRWPADKRYPNTRTG
jgi:hypothetical protein